MLQSFVSRDLLDRLVAEGGQLAEQRRLVTALFVDLSGFTPLAARLDAEAVAAVIDPLLAALVRIVHRHAGYVGSFAGDALLVFFGAPISHEDDADRALRTAWRMLKEFPALLAELGPDASSLGLRCGVESGYAWARLVADETRTDYAVLGDAVNMAQRLQSLAEVGTCWVGEKTQELTGDRFSLTPLGAFHVKGKDEPVRAWELSGVGPRTAPRWKRFGSHHVGRAAEMQALSQHFQRHQLVVVRGEAGMGKTLLLESFKAGDPSHTWAWGASVSADRATSYRPWASVVRSLLPDLQALGEQERIGIEIVLGTHLVEASSDLTPELRRRAVARGVGAVLRSCAPVRVLLEDVHWSDEASLDLIDDVLSEVGDEEVAVVVTTRPSARVAARLMGQGQGRVGVLDLAPLAHEDLEELLTLVLGTAPPGGVVSEVSRRCGGNALFAVELGRAWLQRGVLREMDGGVLAVSQDLSQLVADVPDTLEGLLSARVDDLPSGAAQALALAAVLGTPVRHDVLVAAALHGGWNSGRLDQALGVLFEEELLVTKDSEISFTHALLADAVYSRTPRRRRRSLHLTAAEAALAAPDVDGIAAFVARHLYLAGAGMQAVEALARAAELARARFDLSEAVVHLAREIELRRALDPQDELLHALLTELGEHQELLGRYADAEVVLREAVSLSAGWRADRALAGVLRRLGRYDQAIEVIDRALAEDSPADGRAQLMEEQGWSLVLRGDVHRTLALCERARVLAQGLPDQAALDLLESFCLIRAERPPEAAALARRAVATLEGTQRLAERARAHRLLGSALIDCDQRDEAVTELEIAIAFAERSGSAEEALASLMNLAILHGGAGRYDVALELEVRSIREADRMGHLFARLNTRSNHAYTLFLSGEHLASQHLADEVLSQATTAGLGQVAGSCAHTSASALMALGAFEAAAGRAEEAAALFRSSDAVDAAAQCWELAAQAWGQAGRDDHAAAARTVSIID